MTMEYRNEHYEYKVVPAGEWKRETWQERAMKEGKPDIHVGKTDEPRPHIVPISEDAKKVAAMDGWIGSFGAPLGLILQDGEWVLAYRFIILDPNNAHIFVEDMTAQMTKVMAAARA